MRPTKVTPHKFYLYFEKVCNDTKNWYCHEQEWLATQEEKYSQWLDKNRQLDISTYLSYLEDKLNWLLRNIKSSIIEETYNSLWSSGSRPKLLNELPKAHRLDIVAWPIIISIGIANYNNCKISCLHHLSTACKSAHNWEFNKFRCRIFVCKCSFTQNNRNYM